MPTPSGDDPAAQAAWLLERATGEVDVPVAGISMVPTIPERAVVRARRARPDDLRPGNLVLVRGWRGLVVHRVVRRGRRAREWLVTRGDNRWVPDAPVRAADVLGLVTSVAGGDGWAPPAPAPRPALLARTFTAALAVLMDVHPGLAVGAAALVHALRHGGRGSAG